MAIDIGAEAIDRGNRSSLPDRTYISKTNPANESGIITSVEIWANEDLANCIVGAFYTTNGDTLKCRDSEAIGTVTAGSKQTFPVTITVEAGDYIGIYATGGWIERDVSGGEGVWYVNGQYIDPDDETTYTYLYNYILSLYGIGTEAGGITEYVRDAAVSIGITTSASRATVITRFFPITWGVAIRASRRFDSLRSTWRWRRR